MGLAQYGSRGTSLGTSRSFKGYKTLLPSFSLLFPFSNEIFSIISVPYLDLGGPIP
jgi:hypothetical protein